MIEDFKNLGREWHPAGQPEQVRVHDFIDRCQGKAIPYGVYDLGRNSGWVSVGIDHDTATFAVNAIRCWWRGMGRRAYPKARSLLITADSGSSNGSRLRLWKWELQRLANETGLTIDVCHLPPGDQQMEQDRTSPVLVHQPELARQAFAHPRNGRQSDWIHNHRHGIEGPLRAGQQLRSDQNIRIEATNGRDSTPTR